MHYIHCVYGHSDVDSKDIITDNIRIRSVNNKRFAFSN